MSVDNSEYLAGKKTGKGSKAVIKIDGVDCTNAVLDILSAVHVARSANDDKGRKYTNQAGKEKFTKSIFKTDANQLLKAVHNIDTAKWNRDASGFDRTSTVHSMDVLHYMEEAGYISIDFRTICHIDDKRTARESLTSDDALKALKVARAAVSL
jgi:hypothetical protein